ncbi:cytochrome c oxidase accessory protein CcoG [Helicobacter sp. 23-1048]
MQANTTISTTPHTTNYRKHRYLLYFSAMIFFLGFPFITIDGNHIFLLSFAHGEFHLLGTRFNMQELYLLPFLLIILFVGIFFLTTLGGRMWCGWACPQTIFRTIYRDLLQTKIFKLRNKISNKQRPLRLDSLSDKLKATLAFVIIMFLCLVATANLMFFFVPPLEFFEALANPSQHPILMGFWLGFGLFFTADIAFIQEVFCVYICPYCRVQSVLYDDDTIMPIYDSRRGGAIYNADLQKIPEKLKFREPQAECVECEECVKVCPAHIDIRKGMQLECINCLECVDACGSVQARYNRASLVNWSSPFSTQNNVKIRYFRPKTIAYIAVLAIAFVAILVVSGKKEGMLLNVNTTTQIYQITQKDEGVVISNSFKVLFHNTDSVPHEFYIAIENPSKDSAIADKLKISKPKEPFLVKAGQKRTEIVTVQALEPLSNNQKDDSIFPFVFRAYALDDEEKTFAKRKSNFTYPSQKNIQAHSNKE